jgi:hypothetical protein
MVVHWITPESDSSDRLNFRQKGEEGFQFLEGAHTLLPDGASYTVHSLELIDLKPDQAYEIQWQDKVYFFKTAPKTIKSDIVFVEGGDIYHDKIEVVAAMNRLAASKNPLFAVCGGDLAYSCQGSSRDTERPERWIDWLTCWCETMRAPDGRLIPMLPVIGNHEVKGSGLKPPAQAPFFYHLFSLAEDKGFRTIRFGDYAQFFLLDTNHTHAVSGTQTKWLEENLKEAGVTYRFPVYHVPAYPSHRSYTRSTSMEIRNNWVPLFEKFGVTAAFEHDDHLYKRTHLLRKGIKDPTGVLYLGDGAWGVDKPRLPKTSWYLAKTAPIRHFFLVTLTPREAKFEVIKENGEVFESFTR